MPYSGDARRRESGGIVAAEDAARLSGEAATKVEHAVGVEWYRERRNEVDRAALALCRLRRAKAGQLGSPHQGDAAVRDALAEVSAPALVWLTSRAISYMDESGFPDDVAPWFREDDLRPPDA
jgi:hypothetical protein